MKLGGQHIALPERTPLANVHLTLLNKFGIEQDQVCRQHRHDFGAVSDSQSSWTWIAEQVLKARNGGDAHAVGDAALLRLREQAGSRASGVRQLTDKIAVVDGGGSNVVAFSSGDGLLLVDSGAPERRQADGRAERAWRPIRRSTLSSIRTTISIRPAITSCSPRRAQRSLRTIARVNGCATITGCPTESRYEKARRRPPGRPRRSSIRDP